MPKAQSTVEVLGCSLDVEYEYESREPPSLEGPGWPVVLLDYSIQETTDLTGVVLADIDSAVWHRAITEAIIQQIEFE